MIERRNLTHEFRLSDDAAPKISGYASIFDVTYDAGYWLEKVDPNAFDSVIAAGPDVRALWNHNPDFPLGRTQSGTLSLAIDARGLAYEIDPPATTYANDLIVSMRRKDITQSSFAFVVKRQEWTENEDGTVTRTILEFEELLDVSPVTYPANPSASSSVRSLPTGIPIEIRSKIELRMSEASCPCGCSQCSTGFCGGCSSDPKCVSVSRSTDERSLPDTERHRTAARLKLLSLKKI